MTVRVHPSTFSKNLVGPIAAMLGKFDGEGMLLDPCAGLGWKLGEIADLCGLSPWGWEIEFAYHDWSAPWVHWGDSTAMPFKEGVQAAAACTSFVYPNGMADSFHSNEDSVRHTYVHYLRRHIGQGFELDPNNMAGTNPRRSPRALARFYEIQQQILGEVFRVLVPGAPFVVNTKDPDRVPTYTQETHRQLLAAGFHIEAFQQVDARGLNHGANRELKADHENLTLARRPA